MFSLMYFVLLLSHLTHQSPIVSAYGLPIFSAVHVKVKKNLQFLDDSRHDVFENVGQGEFGHVWVHIREILQSFWVSLDKKCNGEFATFVCLRVCPVSYTHLTLPTKA